MRYFRASLVLLLAAVMSAPCTAQEPVANEAPARFMSAEVWPWAYLDDSRQPAGLLHTLAQRLTQVAGLPLHNRVLPHQRLRHDFRLGNGDFAVLFENPTLDDFAIPLGEVLRSDMFLVAPAGSRVTLSFEGLAGRPVGYIRGTYYGEAFEADQGMIKIATHNLDQALQMLEAGRLDAFLSSDVVLYHTFLAKGIDPADFRLRVYTSGLGGHLYMQREASRPDYGPRLRAALDILRETGELEDIFRVPLVSEPSPR
ncbi:polar amino acid transport system substrate-binding protein [Halopseudomonas xinjiangensis]|uniref:Polar amino acid transport system substrate-binding protein n=1 Tax=Halopseudomonas xinjiangensis TaxID=487184 RepID=A0A1H1UX34_9GAMM|nr:ABC transporter substrate-binding protein [Halopseudomonas xinjiangensis]SDS77082.1 polar amino acid transport system substrate-binding protein [Halopseudomonas xinjiangensis]